MGARMSWLILLQLLSVLVHGYDNVGFDGWYQPVPHRPVDIITDVINDLGVRILQQYTAHGNVAFSPTGVGFVLAALYEGSAGRGRQQIADALGLPRDRDITRIGFRDIHRRLRTYLNADGFLGGLTLNHENTKLRPEYEDILRFYGFDLSIPEEDTDETTSVPEATTGGLTEQPTTEARTTGPDETTVQTATMTTTTQIPTSQTSTTQTATTQTVTMQAATTQTATTQTATTQTATTQTATTQTATTQTATTQTATQTATTQTATQTATTQTAATQSPTTQQITTQSEQSSESTSQTPEPTTPSVELLGMTLSTMDEQDRLTETTPAGAVSMGGTKAAATTLPSSITTSSTETIASTTPTSPITTPTDSSTSTEGSQTTTSPVPPTTMAVITTVQSPRTQSTPSTLSTFTSTTTVPTPTSTASEMPAAMTEGTSEPTTTFAPTESVTEPGPESTTTSTTSSTANVTTVAVEKSVETSATPPVNVTEASTSSTIPTRDQTPIGPTDGPPADENTVSTDSPNNQSISNEMGSTDLPVTTVAAGEIGSTGQLTTVSSATMMNRRKRSYRGPRGFFSSYPDEGIWMQDLGIWKPYSTSLNEASVRDSTEISFLVNGCDVSSVTASRYFAVLPFAYFPSLHAVALEFPLDDPRYNIILMMATDRRDTYRLARDLGGKSLRLLRKQLQSTWVRATIPSFMLRGFVTLTSFLQRLGILDVFEPRAADLSPMTPDLGVYARDAQQSIGVNIRNYMKPDRTHSRNGLFERAGPVPFTVVQPFLYFIVDAETSVALIAGRVNDPLNSRIL